MTNSRRLAVEILARWESEAERVGSRCHAEDLVAARARRHRLAASDRAQLTALVFGVLRHRTLLDFWIGGLLDRPGRRLPDAVRQALRVALLELLVLGSAPHAAVSEAVALAPRPLRAVTNAVLRRADRERARLLAEAAAQPPEVRHSHPAFLVERWTRLFGEEAADRLLEWDNVPADLSYRAVGPNASRAVPDGADGPRELSAFSFASTRIWEQLSPGVRAALETLAFFRGDRFLPEAAASARWYLQDPSTALAPAMLAPEPGERVLDACAAPGGKTILMADLSDRKAEIGATDRSATRLARLEENLDRTGIRPQLVAAIDWADPESGPPRPPALADGSFDAVLLDVPCSNSGVLRRRVDARWRIDQPAIDRLRATQESLLRNTLALVRPGGRLVYSTCSIDATENRACVDAVLDGQPDFHITGEILTFPPDDGIDGAYAARIERRS